MNKHYIIIFLSAILFSAVALNSIKKAEAAASEKAKVTITYPDAFYQNELSSIGLSTSLTNVKTIKLFASKSSTVDDSAGYNASNICKEIAKSANKDNCSICHPSTVSCNNGVCADTSITMSELGKHRLVAVAFKTDGTCRQDLIAGINNALVVNVSLKPAQAAATAAATASTKINVTGGTSITTLQGFLDRFINVFLIGFMGIGFFISLIVGGFTYLTAGPNEQKVGTAKKIIAYSLIGLILATLSYALFANAIVIINSIFGK